MRSSMTGTLILQARMGSQRLPGKSALKLLDKPMLDLLMQRLERLACTKWLATSDDVEDKVLVEMAKNRGWQVLRGSKEDVLSRFVEILAESADSYCLRVTGDNPLVCPKGLSVMIENFTSFNQKFDYMSDFDFGHYPTGAFAEIFSVQQFLSGVKNIPESEPWHRAHVTSWMRKTTRISSLLLPGEFVQRPTWRWTVDYDEDYEFFQQLIEVLGKSWITFTYPEIVKVLDRYPEILKINSGMKQKSIELG
jgi:spore coat polysaccharide biosynthesis protein SpsF